MVGGDIMDGLFRIQQNVVSALFLGLVLILAFFRLDRKDRLNRLFFILGLIVFIQINMETITCIINGKNIPGARIISIFFHVCLYIVAPILTFTWYQLVKKLVGFSQSTKGRTLALMLPLFISFVIVFITPWTNLAFSVSVDNVYRREDFFYFVSISTYFYMILAFVHICIHRRKIIRHELWLFLLFSIIPVLGGIVQIMVYGILLMWSLSALSLIFLYLFLQERMIHVDGLTGTWTRTSLYTYLEREMRSKQSIDFGLIYFDIDQLKYINDHFGHGEGDNAIIQAVEIISSIVQKRGIMARVGGDEFAIIIQGATKSLLEEIVNQCNNSFEDYNLHQSIPYCIRCSFGYSLYESDIKSIEEWMHRVDMLMYKEKTKKKQILETNKESFLNN
jgi:diguanylate cyclase (GGDEF)-like protein